jgi:hypothetical protein
MAESVWFWLAMLFAGVIGVLLTSFAFHAGGGNLIVSGSRVPSRPGCLVVLFRKQGRHQLCGLSRMTRCAHGDVAAVL